MKAIQDKGYTFADPFDWDDPEEFFDQEYPTIAPSNYEVSTSNWSSFPTYFSQATRMYPVEVLTSGQFQPQHVAGLQWPWLAKRGRFLTVFQLNSRVHHSVWNN